MSEEGIQDLIGVMNITLKGAEDLGKIGMSATFQFGVKKEYCMLEIQWKLLLRKTGSYTADAGDSAAGNLQRIANMVKKLDEHAANLQGKIEHCQHEMARLQAEYEKPFAQEEEYNRKISRQKELEALLSKDSQMDAHETEELNVNVKRRVR